MVEVLEFALHTLLLYQLVLSSEIIQTTIVKIKKCATIFRQLLQQENRSLHKREY